MPSSGGLFGASGSLAELGSVKEWLFVSSGQCRAPVPVFVRSLFPSREEGHGLDVSATGELPPELLCSPCLGAPRGLPSVGWRDQAY